MGSDSAIVLDRHALHGGGVAPLHRDRQLGEIRSCFIGSKTQFRPVHALASGPPGAGKTYCIRHVLTIESAKLGLFTAHVDVSVAFSFLGVIERILEVAKPLRRTQRNREVQLAQLREALADRRSVIVLDDIDLLPAADVADLLRHLCSLPNTAVLCIAADTRLLTKLPESVRSRFSPRLIPFAAYTPAELRSILEAVVHRSLRPESWTAPFLDKVVDRAHGDARRLLALLRHAVVRAEGAGASMLEPYHLRVVNSTDFRPAPDLALNEHHRLLVDLVRRNGTIATGALETAYRDACRRHVLDPIARRTLVKYLGFLVQRRLLHRERSPASKGFVYQLLSPERSSDGLFADDSRKPLTESRGSRNRADGTRGATY